MDCQVYPQVSGKQESLFERTYWLYALCRQYLFRDQTNIIAKGLFPGAPPGPGTQVLELGCGPGFYACRLARKFPQLQATGVDMSPKLIEWARARAQSKSLSNASFLLDDAQALKHVPPQVDAVVVSRLFLIIPDKEAVLSEIFRVLRPGGRCFIAEPTASLRTRLPLRALWAVARLSVGPVHRYPEPRHQDGMPPNDFKALMESQPWSEITFGRDRWYQYAICTKPGVPAAVQLPESAA